MGSVMQNIFPQRLSFRKGFIWWAKKITAFLVDARRGLMRWVSSYLLPTASSHGGERGFGATSVVLPFNHRLSHSHEKFWCNERGPTFYPPPLSRPREVLMQWVGPFFCPLASPHGHEKRISYNRYSCTSLLPNYFFVRRWFFLSMGVTEVLYPRLGTGTMISYPTSYF